MKKISFAVLLLAAALLLTACGGNPSPEKAIIGSWKAVKAEYQDGTDAMESAFGSLDEGGYPRLTFTEDGKWIMEIIDANGNVGRNNTMSYALQDGKLTMNGMEAKFELSGDTLKITDSGSSTPITVTMHRMK